MVCERPTALPLQNVWVPGYRLIPLEEPRPQEQALELYLEGLWVRSIGRFLKYSHVGVHHWIKSYGESIETIRSPSGVKVIKMDEMHTYIGSKKLLLDRDCC